MAQLIDIQSVVIDPQRLSATVRIADDAPLFTSDDIVGTNLVYEVVPGIADHACLGDAGRTFGAAIDDTELAHLLEHVTVELLALTNIAGDISAGRTRPVRAARTYEVQLACPDDVLVVGALSSAAWILEWAYSGGGEPEPDVDAIVQGLVGLVESLPPVEEPAAEVEVTPEVEPEPEAEPVAEVEADPAAEPAAEAEPEPEGEPANEPAPAPDPEPETGEPAADPEPETAETADAIPSDEADTSAGSDLPS